MTKEEIEKLKDSAWNVRRRVASNPSTPVDALLELSKDSAWNVRSSVASNPSTPVDALLELSKDSDCDVRSSVASNPSTPVDALLELSKDSAWNVRSSVASNPSTPGYVNVRKFEKSDRYVATLGTTHLWYKYKAEKPFYVCGCFIGSREQLIGKIIFDGGDNFNERMRILDILDTQFDIEFNTK